MLMLWSAPGNISAPLFFGPVYTAVDYYFVCRVVYTGCLPVNVDVTLTFDDEILPGTAVQTLSSTSSLDAIFRPRHFAGHFGKTVGSLWIDSVS